MKKILKCECNEDIIIEVVGGEEVEVVCPRCRQTLRGIAGPVYVQLGEIFTEVSLAT